MREPLELSTEEMRQFRSLIYDLAGISIPTTKVTMLSNRIRKRLRAGGYEDYAQYLEFLKQDQNREEREEFLNAITTNETFFFRTPTHFDWITSNFVPEFAALVRKEQHPSRLKLWSAACSSGEEPYSIAITLLENQFRLRGINAEVTGTDLSERVLSMAREGHYGERSMNTVSDKRRRRYFQYEKQRDRWTVTDAVKTLVKFEHHNLLEPSPRTDFDCIFIRNVLIYFDRVSKRKTLRHLTDALRPGGYLIVGPSEGVFDLLGDYKRITPFCYQKPPASPS